MLLTTCQLWSGIQCRHALVLARKVYAIFPAASLACLLWKATVGRSPNSPTDWSVYITWMDWYYSRQGHGLILGHGLWSLMPTFSQTQPDTNSTAFRCKLDSDFLTLTHMHIHTYTQIHIYTHTQTGFPACSAGDPSSIPGSGRSPGEGTGYPLLYSWASLVAQTVKNPPAMWETWIQSLGWRGSSGEGKGLPTPVFLPGESPWTEELGGLQSMDHKESDTTERLNTA